MNDTPKDKLTTIAKSAGIVGGFLGICCVLAELCFLFPDLLVSRDLRPMYAAKGPRMNNSVAHGASTRGRMV